MNSLLMEKIKGITSTGLNFMEGMEKGDTVSILDEIVTVNNYGFLEGAEGKFVVFTTLENDTEFYFGSSVVTQSFIKLDDMLNEEEKKVILSNGLPIKLSERKSKSKRTYVKVDFYPEG